MDWGCCASRAHLIIVLSADIFEIWFRWMRIRWIIDINGGFIYIIYNAHHQTMYCELWCDLSISTRLFCIAAKLKSLLLRNGDKRGYHIFREYYLIVGGIHVFSWCTRKFMKFKEHFKHHLVLIYFEFVWTKAKHNLNRASILSAPLRPIFGK